MKLTKYSKDKILNTFAAYTVPKDYADPIMNYLVYGFSPGSFFTAILANDYSAAMAHSHPANSIPSLKDLNSWVVNNLPRGEMWGSYQAVDSWFKLTTEQRRAKLEELQLIYTEIQEVELILTDAPTKTPMFFD
jgi:hypothetical protein